MSFICLLFTKLLSRFRDYGSFYTIIDADNENGGNVAGDGT